GRELAAPCVARRDLELGLWPLELQLRHALDGGAGEERLVRDESDLAPASLLLWLRQRPPSDVLLRLRVAAQRRPLADLAEREAAVDALGDLGEDGGRIRRHADVEPCSELGDPVELVEARRLDRTTPPLEPALEVHEGAVAPEIARA